MISEAARAEFDRDGILKVASAFSERAASRMRDVVWNELRHRYQIERDDPGTWDRHPPTGLKSTKKSRAFDPICGPAVSETLDDLLGPGRWARPRQFGNVLVTMPENRPWRVPDRIWHSDFEATASTTELFAVKLWALFGDVAPSGGGTPQLAGSHRLFARYVADREDRDYQRVKEGFLRSHAWLRALSTDDGDPNRNRRFMTETDIDGLPARVVETSGTAGDVFITHGWVFHTIATNASRTPRLMRSVGIRRLANPATGSGGEPNPHN